MKVCVLGAGAIGGLLAWQLADSHPADVVVAVRRPAHACALGRSGLTLVDQEGSSLGTRYLPALTPTDALEPQDIVFVTTKAYDVATAVSDFRSLIHENTIVVSLQNGIGAPQEIADALQDRRPTLLRAVTANGATRQSDKCIRTGGSGPTYLGPAVGDADFTRHAVKRVTELLSSSGWDPEPVRNIAPYEWAKLLVNVGINPVTALLDQRNGVLLRVEHARQLAQQLVIEAQQVVEALGIQLPWDDDPLSEVLRVASDTSENYSSMLQDLKGGRRTEIDYINGAIVRHGVQLGLEARANSAIVLLLKAREVLQTG